MLKHCSDKLAFYWYLRALHDPVVRRGFWLLEDDYAERKEYLDNLLVSSKGLFGKYSIY
jgi:hypothetical protein